MSAAVIEALRAELGGAVLAGDDIPARNEQDWSTLGPLRPLAVVRPARERGRPMTTSPTPSSATSVATRVTKSSS